MGSLGLLLNPVDEPRLPKSSPTISEAQLERGVSRPLITETPRRLDIPRSPTFTRSPSLSPQQRKKPKICKDAAVFATGPTRGEVRYLPDEFRDEALKARHQEFGIYPMGNITDYPRHIPYNSEKKTFLIKTGREHFEVFQYNFRIPGEEKVHCMMWDYNIGLVRTTALFKCTGHSKTTPAKMLNRNVGLREICHSITGGALVAQGYWMPFEAAKAIATTFCWRIRYALTPVFGRDFPASCIPPHHDKFGEMFIDGAITRKCTEQVRQYRLLEEKLSTRNTPSPCSPLTPDTPTYPKSLKQLRAKPAYYTSPSDYATETSDNDSYYTLARSPDSSSIKYRNVWTPVNTPRSVPAFDGQLPSPRSLLAEAYRRRRNVSPDSDDSSPPLSPKSKRVRRVDVTSRGQTAARIDRQELSCKELVGQVPSDEKAAWLLMSLKLGRCDDNRQLTGGTKRRASH